MRLHWPDSVCNRNPHVNTNITAPRTQTSVATGAQMHAASLSQRKSEVCCITRTTTHTNTTPITTLHRPMRHRLQPYDLVRSNIVEVFPATYT